MEPEDLNRTSVTGTQKIAWKALPKQKQSFTAAAEVDGDTAESDAEEVCVATSGTSQEQTEQKKVSWEGCESCGTCHMVLCSVHQKCDE